MNPVDDSVSAPVVKIASAWGVVGVSMWVDYAQLIAATLAALYTLILLGEWAWKKLKWLRRKDRRVSDQ